MIYIMDNGIREKLIRKLEKEFQPYFSLAHPSNSAKASELKEDIRMALIKAQTKEEIENLMDKIEKFKLVAMNFNNSKPLEKIDNKKNALDILIQSLNKNVNMSQINFNRLAEKKASRNNRVQKALQKRYGFHPVFTDNGEPVIDSIYRIYEMRLNEKKFVTSNANSKSENPDIQILIDKYKEYFAARDIKRTPGKYSTFLKLEYPYDEIDRLIEVVKYYGEEKNLLYYTQFWDYSYVIAYVMADGRLNDTYYIFKEMYPYYTFIHDRRFWNTINFVTFYTSKVPSDYKSAAQQILQGNVHNPLSMSILAGDIKQKKDLISIYLEKNPGKKSFLMDKLKVLLYYSDYTKKETAKYISDYGLMFLNVALYLPSILYFKDYSEKKILKQKRKILKNLYYKTNSADIIVIRDPYFMFEYLIGLSDEYILSEYKKIINTYIDQFKYDYIMAMTETYNESQINKNKKGQSFNKKELDFLIVRTFSSEITYQDVPNNTAVIGRNLRIDPKNKFTNVSREEYTFNPEFVGGGEVIDDIKFLYSKKVIGDSKKQTEEDLHKNIKKTNASNEIQNRSYVRLASFFKGYSKNKVVDIKNQIYDIMRKHHLEDPSSSYSQNNIKFLLQSFLFTNSIEMGLYVFDQTYPFISFFNEQVIFENISIINFLASISRNNNIESFKQDYYFIFPQDSCLSIKIIQNDLINEYANPDLIKDKLRLIYRYCNYANNDVKELYKKYGLVFLNLAIYLPELMYHQFIKRKEFDVQGVVKGKAILDWFLAYKDDVIKTLMERTIQKYASKIYKLY